MSNAMTTANYVREVTMFCLRRKGNCFKGWEPHIVFRFIAFHCLAGTLEVVREGRAILGAAIAYTGDVRYFREHEGEPFGWTIPPSGNALFIGDVVAKKAAIPQLWSRAMNKYPWITSILTYRRGRLVQLRFDALNRMSGLEAV